MPQLVMRLLFGGLLSCAGITAIIAGIVLYRKVWLPGKSFADLGGEGSVVIFMGLLIGACLVLAWRVRAAQRKLPKP